MIGLVCYSQGLKKGVVMRRWVYYGVLEFILWVKAVLNRRAWACVSRGMEIDDAVAIKIQGRRLRRYLRWVDYTVAVEVAWWDLGNRFYKGGV